MKLEDICYSLKFWPPAATDLDEANMKLIAQVLKELPPHVCEQVLEDVTFICIEGQYGYYEKWCCTPHRKELNKDVIILNFSALKSEEVSIKKTVIAHEVAHYFLEHNQKEDDERDKEKEADDLCESWGFGRAYDNYENC